MFPDSNSQNACLLAHQRIEASRLSLTRITVIGEQVILSRGLGDQFRAGSPQGNQRLSENGFSHDAHTLGQQSQIREQQGRERRGIGYVPRVTEGSRSLIRAVFPREILHERGSCPTRRSKRSSAPRAPITATNGEPVTEAELRAIWDLMKWGPTCASS